MTVTRRGAGLVAGTAATLLLSAWVSAAGPVGVFARQSFSGTESKAPGEDFGPGPAASATTPGLERAADRVADPFLVSLVGLVMKLVLAVVVIVVLVAIGRALRDRWVTPEEKDEHQLAGDALPEVLLEGAREGEQLLARGTPGNAVIAAWVALEDAVRSVGLRDDDSRTSEELVTTVLRAYRVDRAPLDTLAGLYREARFSRHPISEEQRSNARDALVQVQSDLRQTLAKHAQERAARGTPAQHRETAL